MTREEIEKRAREMAGHFSGTLPCPEECRGCEIVSFFAGSLQEAYDAGAVQHVHGLSCRECSGLRVEGFNSGYDTATQQFAPAHPDLAERYREAIVALEILRDMAILRGGPLYEMCPSHLLDAMDKALSTPAAPSAAAPHCDECDPGPCKHFEAMLEACKQVEEKKP